MSRKQIGIVAFVALAAVLVFGRGEPSPDCTPHPVPVAGWKLPFSVTIGDSVVSWQPNQHAAQKEAVQVAYHNPDATVRVASITEMMWRLRDGSPCESTWQPEGKPTPRGEVEWTTNR